MNRHLLRGLATLALTPFFVTSIAFAQETKPADPPAGTDPADAEAIATADRIEKKVEKLRGLKFEHSVKKGIYDKERLAKFLKKQTEKEKVDQQYAWQEKVYKILGLIPESMDMLKETNDVLMEQIGGFYDPESKELRVMRGFKGFLGDILMAHELCHALEDQHFDLQAIDDANKSAAPDNDDRVFAAHAVMEGSATDLMTAFMKNAMLDGKVDMQELLKADIAGNPALSGERAMAAPPIIVRPLMEMYMSGQAFLTRGGGMLARAERKDVKKTFLSPPLSSEQVLHPEKYWDKDKIDLPREITLPDVTKTLGAGWRMLGTNVMGELGIAILTKPAPDPKKDENKNAMARQMEMLMGKKTTPESEGWDGDRYVLYSGPDGVQVFYWYSVWDTENDGQEFMKWINENYNSAKRIQSVHTHARGSAVLVALGKTADGAPLKAQVAERMMAAAEELLEYAKAVEGVPLHREMPAKAQSAPAGK
ncbi:MAG: hypothetical protein HY286_09745 [Planctomycetes bacterium]|nr:hypothetical protein [Planctomycetota bacterium]